MGIGTHPLPSLGQVQSGDSRKVMPFSPHPPESRALVVEASERSLIAEEYLGELRNGPMFHSSRFMSALMTNFNSDSHIYSPNEPRDLSSDEVQLPWQELNRSLQQQLVVVGLQHAATLHDEAQTTIRPPYRGRITGPIRFVNQLLATWQLEAEKACILLGLEPSRLPYVNAVLQGYETLTGRDAKDRIAHLFQIRKLLSALFRDEAVENEWLREPQDILKGKVPMDLFLEGSMENLLLVREYVERVTGR